ncbi:hypothetical protein V565_018320 [Rhizoctonia solani 123E]|uniref:BHLH domain-containing protein n=1 Tax=Rhizoctonia solani 123E TaxID=1423351 RepID=A0A074SWW4_9AGAM|nr:hypothetical protein V565_018320 [Rhizoctonia solani 123E]
MAGFDDFTFPPPTTPWESPVASGSRPRGHSRHSSTSSVPAYVPVNTGRRGSTKDPEALQAALDRQKSRRRRTNSTASAVLPTDEDEEEIVEEGSTSVLRQRQEDARIIRCDAEQQRRNELGKGYDRLRSVLNRGDERLSKYRVVERATARVVQLRDQNERMEDELRRKQEIIRDLNRLVIVYVLDVADTPLDATSNSCSTLPVLPPCSLPRPIRQAPRQAAALDPARILVSALSVSQAHTIALRLCQRPHTLTPAFSTHPTRPANSARSPLTIPPSKTHSRIIQPRSKAITRSTLPSFTQPRHTHSEFLAPRVHTISIPSSATRTRHTGLLNGTQPAAGCLALLPTCLLHPLVLLLRHPPMATSEALQLSEVPANTSTWVIFNRTSSSSACSSSLVSFFPFLDLSCLSHFFGLLAGSPAT